MTLDWCAYTYRFACHGTSYLPTGNNEKPGAEEIIHNDPSICLLISCRSSGRNGIIVFTIILLLCGRTKSCDEIRTAWMTVLERSSRYLLLEAAEVRRSFEKYCLPITGELTNCARFLNPPHFAPFDLNSSLLIGLLNCARKRDGEKNGHDYGKHGASRWC